MPRSDYHVKGLQGPSFKYLTKSYVEWLGLEPHLHFVGHISMCYWISENATKPVTQDYDAYEYAVVYNHALYFREPDGLAWVRKNDNHVYNPSFESSSVGWL